MPTMAKPGSVNRSSIHRPADDHYPTPREAVYPLIRHLVLPKRIWEPACGEGHIAEVLKEYDHRVIATNLIDRGYGKHGVDFLAERKKRADCIVTNPPFSLHEEFVEHAIRLKVGTTIMFLPIACMCGAVRFRRLHGPHPPRLILPIIERIIFFAGDTPEEDQPGESKTNYAWFVWQRGYVGKPTIDWLSRDDGYQRDLFRPLAP